MSKKKGITGINLIDHLHELRTKQISERLGVTFHIFENKEEDDVEELDEVTEYGYDAKQEVGHEKRQGKQKPMQSIDEPASKVGHRGPKLAKQGPNKHKEDNIKEGDFKTQHPSKTDVTPGRDLELSRDDLGYNDKYSSTDPGGEVSSRMDRRKNREALKKKADYGRIGEQEELEETTEYGYDAKQEVGHEKKQGKQKPMQAIDTHAKGAGSADPGLRKKGANKHKESGMKESNLNEAVNSLLKTIHEFRKQRGNK